MELVASSEISSLLNNSRFFTCMLLVPILAVIGFSSPASRNASGLDDEVLKYANQFRRANGLAPLIMRPDLSTIARRHSEDMARGRQGFGHGGFDSRAKQIERSFKSGAVAENVAYGQGSAREVVTDWKNSAGHRRNLLGNYQYTGIGTARDRAGRIYFTQLFIR